MGNSVSEFAILFDPSNKFSHYAHVVRQRRENVKGTSMNVQTQFQGIPIALRFQTGINIFMNPAINPGFDKWCDLRPRK